MLERLKPLVAAKPPFAAAADLCHDLGVVEMRMTKHAALAGAWLALAAGAIAQPPGTSQSGKTLTGATFTIAEGWTEHVTGAVVRLDPPETDTHVAIVDVTRAADAKSAAAVAWKLYRPRASRPFK